jgi:hypothetical protein
VFTTRTLPWAAAGSAMVVVAEIAFCTGVVYSGVRLQSVADTVAAHTAIRVGFHAHLDVTVSCTEEASVGTDGSGTTADVPHFTTTSTLGGAAAADVPIAAPAPESIAARATLVASQGRLARGVRMFCRRPCMDVSLIGGPAGRPRVQRDSTSG